MEMWIAFSFVCLFIARFLRNAPYIVNLVNPSAVNREFVIVDCG